MKILIIGSKGFIGSYVLDHFNHSGREVYGADVVVDYGQTNYFLIDATNSDFHALFSEHHFDVCINCSGAASVPDSMEHPLRDYLLNTVNVFRILEAIRLLQPHCRFINLSSAAVYGNPQELPIRESLSLSPLSPYGLHKLQAEQILREFHRYYGIQTVSLRVFSAYGSGLKKQLFWDLYQKATSGAPFTLYGTGAETRDFIHVTDIARAIDLVVQNCSFTGNAINIANGVQVPIHEAVKCFFQQWSQPPKYSFSGEERAGDPNCWVADISILEEIGYSPKVSLELGLKKYYEWVSRIG